MGIELTRAERYVSNLDKRMPFHFGNVVATEGPHHFLEVTVEIDGESHDGLSMVGMSPMWFLKDPDLSLTEATEDLLDVFASATGHALDVDPADTVFDFWVDLYEQQAEWGAESPHPPLLWTYGVSMVEQAVIDAFCRANETTFSAAVRDGTLGIEPGYIYNELEGADVSKFLPDEPTREAAVRHTVGLEDPLWRDDIGDEERLDDGLPQSLEGYVEADGVDHLKIKLSADEERDADRLARIGNVLDASNLDYFCTLDANEQYDSVRTFKAQWERHNSDPELSSVLDAVAYVEQPLPRSKALTEETREVLSAWDDSPSIIIDESDDRLDSAGRAIDCGYAGTSHKNCKGVFKGLINACLIEKRRQETGDEFVMSGEDLTTIGPVELLHDLAVMGSIGTTHVERNGHHYYRGLSFLDDDLQETVLDAHPDLFDRHDAGYVEMAVEDGEMAFGSVVDAPFGRDFELDASRFVPIDEWTIESMYE